MPRALRWGLLLASLVPAFPARAYAEDPVPEREAQARFEEGVARVKAGNIDGARMSFAQAYALVRKPTILWNLALAEEKTAHPLEALNHFRELARGSQTADDRSNAEKHIGALMAQTGHLEVVAPAGTQLLVDGAAVAILPLAEAVDVSAGRHRLEVHTEQGARDADVEVGAGQLLHVSLIPPAEPPTAPKPDNASPATTGNARGSATTSSRASEQVVAVVLLGTVTAVSVALGAYFAIQTQSDQSTADGFRQNYGKSFCFRGTSLVCTQWNQAVQAETRDATFSDVFYVAGGALAAGAVGAWLFWPKATTGADGASAASITHGPLRALALAPTVWSGGAGLTAVGRF
jgi:hypothetical protein